MAQWRKRLHILFGPTVTPFRGRPDGQSIIHVSSGLLVLSVVRIFG